MNEVQFPEIEKKQKRISLTSYRGTKLKRKLAEDGKEAIKNSSQCISGYGGQNPTSEADGSPLITTHGTFSSPQKNSVFELYPCAHYSSSSCCSNVLAQEIQMAYDHFFDVGGSGAGRPRNNGSCRLHALTNYAELNVFCIYYDKSLQQRIH